MAKFIIIVINEFDVISAQEQNKKAGKSALQFTF